VLEEMISVIVPVFNEERNIEKTLTGLTKTLQDLACSFEIIVVNDGSTDNTRDVLSGKAGIRLISYESNRGKGYALRAGLRRARGEFVGYIDGDGEIDPAYLADFYKEITRGDCEVIIGRKVRLKKDPLRKLYSHGFRFLVRFLFGLKVDTQTGIKLFDRKAKSLSGVRNDGYLYDLEFLIACSEQGFRIKEMPVVLADSKKLNRIHFLQVLGLLTEMVNLKIWRSICSRQESYGYYSL
jgi:glycosyltransferase involved in cell wall biosynthesis